MAYDTLARGVAPDRHGTGDIPTRLCPRATHRLAARPVRRLARQQVPPASDFGAAASWRLDDGWDDTEDWDDHEGRFAEPGHLPVHVRR